MPIFTGQLYKYFKQASTYIFLVIGLLIVLVSSILVPFILSNNIDSFFNSSNYLNITSTSIISFASFASIITAIFGSLKLVQIYRSEVNDGTFLTLISKPVSKTRIILEKYLAFFVLLIIYIFLLIIFYQILVASLDPFSKIITFNSEIKSISSQIIAIGGILFAILLVSSLFLSSIALLISLKLNTLTSVSIIGGILLATIIFGNTIQSTTNKIENNSVNLPYSDNLINVEKVDPFKDHFREGAKLISTDSNVNDVEKNLENSIQLFNKSVDSSYNNSNSLNYLTYKNGDKNNYSSIFWIDFNYQLSVLGTYASDSLSPNTNNKNFFDYQNSFSSLNPVFTGKKITINNNVKLDDIVLLIKNSINNYSNLIKNIEFIKFKNQILEFIANFYELPDAKILIDNFEIDPFGFVNAIFKTGKIEYSVQNAIDLMRTPTQFIKVEGEESETNFLREVPISSLIDQMFNVYFNAVINQPISNLIIHEYGNFDNSLGKYYSITKDEENILQRGNYISTDQASKALEILKEPRNKVLYDLYNENSNNSNTKNGLFNSINDDLVILANIAQMQNNQEDSSEINFNGVLNINNLEIIKYEHFANREALISVYVIISIFSIPLTLWIVKRKDVK